MIISLLSFFPVLVHFLLEIKCKPFYIGYSFSFIIHYDLFGYKYLVNTYGLRIFFLVDFWKYYFIIGYLFIYKPLTCYCIIGCLFVEYNIINMTLQLPFHGFVIGGGWALEEVPLNVVDIIFNLYNIIFLLIQFLTNWLSLI